MSSRTAHRLGVIGDPVAHSISPAMQQPALDALGIGATYERWHTPLADLPGRIASLRADDVIGANVTVPHKQAVMPLLDDITDLARRAGAVNTIVNRDGRLSGDNTDIPGFARSLRDACPDAASRTALILGAGGASRGIVLALESVGVTDIVIANRNRDRAQDLANDLAPAPVRVIGYGDADFAAAFPVTGILVNATAIGWHPGESPISLGLLAHLPADALVADLTYRDTDLLIAARERGLQTLDGLPMLVYQGAEALERWFGRPAPVDIMMAAALAARANRA